MTGTPWDNSAGEGAVTSVNGYTGDVTLSAVEVDADPAGTAEAAITAHLSATDPHPRYQARDEAGQPGGYAQLDGDGLVLQDPASASASPGANKLVRADSAGKLDSGWGGAASTLATLDASGLVPTSEQGSGSANSGTFLRGDRTWATALQGNLGGTDNALLRADGAGGGTAKGSSARLDNDGNLFVGSRGLQQPITPSAWSGATTSHDLPLPTWATATGRYFALVRVRAQQSSPTASFMARSAQIELTYNGSAWSIDATGQYTSMGPLAPSLGWMIVSGSTLRMTLAGLGSSSVGNVGLVLEQFIFYGAL